MTTAHMKFDQTSDKIADRVRNLRSSAVRDLFAAAVRPDIISLSGGMPDVSLLPQRAIQKAVHAAVTDERAVALLEGLDQDLAGGLGALAGRDDGGVVAGHVGEGPLARAVDVLVLQLGIVGRARRVVDRGGRRRGGQVVARGQAEDERGGADEGAEAAQGGHHRVESLSAQWKDSPQAQVFWALGLSIVKPCFSIVSTKSMEAPPR